MANPPISQTKFSQVNFNPTKVPVSPVKSPVKAPIQGPFQNPYQGPVSMGPGYTNRPQRHEIRDAKRHGDWDWFGGPPWSVLWLQEAYAIDLFEEEEEGLLPLLIDLWP